MYVTGVGVLIMTIKKLCMESGGSLIDDKKQFGTNLHASRFIPLQKNVITVPSFFETKEKCSSNPDDNNRCKFQSMELELNIPKAILEAAKCAEEGRPTNNIHIRKEDFFGKRI